MVRVYVGGRGVRRKSFAGNNLGRFVLAQIKNPRLALFQDQTGATTKAYLCGLQDSQVAHLGDGKTLVASNLFIGSIDSVSRDGDERTLWAKPKVR